MLKVTPLKEACTSSPGSANKEMRGLTGPLREEANPASTKIGPLSALQRTRKRSKGDDKHTRGREEEIMGQPLRHNCIYPGELGEDRADD